MVLPLGASEIFVEWRKDEYGLGITAFTDRAGNPYIGLYPLDFEGYRIGMPVYFKRRHIMADVVVGIDGDRPVAVFIDVEVTRRGVDVRLCVPMELAQDCIRHLWARWGDPSPVFDALSVTQNKKVLP